MGASETLHDFLLSRRARIRPHEAGLVDDGPRRVPGLRREEVALLADVSLSYYIQIERGRLSGISNDVLDRIADALQFDPTEREYFFCLARNLHPESSRHASPHTSHVPSGLQALLNAMHDTAAVVMTPSVDIVGSNALGRALFEPVFEHADGIANFALFVFLNEQSREFYGDWSSAARNVVGLLRLESVRSPQCPRVTEIIGLLSSSSCEFHSLWDRHEVSAPVRSEKTLRHPRAGELDLRFETLTIPGTGDMQVLSYFAAPGTESYQRLQDLLTLGDGGTHSGEQSLCSVA